MTTTSHETSLPPLVVDRSPELSRAATRSGGLFGRPLEMEPEDISESVRGSGAKCALARLIYRKIGKVANLEGERPTIDGKPVWLGPDIIEWIGRYDRGEPVEPITINLCY